MKKAFALALALMLLLSLVACGEPEPTGTKKPNSEKPGTSQPASTPAATETIYVLVSQIQTRTVGDTVSGISKILNTYDENGLLVKQERHYEDGTVTAYTPQLDSYGRVIRLEANIEQGLVAVDYTYDENGNILSEVTSFNGAETYSTHRTFDADSNLLTVTMNFSDGSSQMTQYYYENGRMVKEELYNDGALSQYNLYEYDEQGRILVKHLHWGSGALIGSASYTYSEDGLTVYTDFPKYKLNGVNVYDEHGNMIRTESIDVGGSTVTEYIYQAVEVPAEYPRKS